MALTILIHQHLVTWWHYTSLICCRIGNLKYPGPWFCYWEYGYAQLIVPYYMYVNKKNTALLKWLNIDDWSRSESKYAACTSRRNNCYLVRCNCKCMLVRLVSAHAREKTPCSSQLYIESCPSLIREHNACQLSKKFPYISLNWSDYHFFNMYKVWSVHS